MMRLMSMRSVLLVSALVMALTGCTESADEAAVADSTPLVAEAIGSRFRQDAVIPENGTAPQAFLDRKRLPSCGSYAWTLSDGGPPAHVWRRLADSLDAGDPAELIVQAPGSDSTTVSYYRVDNGGAGRSVAPRHDGRPLVARHKSRRVRAESAARRVGHR